MWSFKSAKQKAQDAPPKPDPSPFVVPDYTHGSPYVQSNPVYADSPQINTGHHNYEPVTQQQTMPRIKTYPDADKPADKWRGYYTESWQRSEKEEHARGEEGFPNPQEYHRMALNPYFKRNVVNRPQRTPHEYSFLRRFDQQILGARNLNGNHFSQAQIGQSVDPLKGMSVNVRRRSTYRLEPTQFDVATIGNNIDANGIPINMTFTSPDVGFPDRSYRLP
ncbi:MAG: hypothetical protein ACRDUW_03410 [Pseudonocardiaceae bacterium]